ncbi:MAG: hypothetical protein NXI04_23725 [Planctomycetaceae bacterium]|nr:hypothetical protein [Planctomycetaceae bacterium]
MTSENSLPDPEPPDPPLPTPRAPESSDQEGRTTEDPPSVAQATGDQASDDAPSETSVSEPPLPEPVLGELLPWHLALRDHLRSADQSVWEWFAPQPGTAAAPPNDRADDETTASERGRAAVNARRELLKTAYRLDRDSEADVYQLAERLRDQMGLSPAVTLYQAQNVHDLTACLVWVPGELHVVFGGPLRDVLTEQEVGAVLCHEFAHYELFEVEDGDLLRVDRMLSAMAADCAADSPHHRTLRTFRLWSELYCDRRAAQVLGGINDCVSALVKVETGLKDVNPDAYCKQAQELVATGPLTSEGLTHPETFLRAFALDRWASDPDSANEAIVPLVEGPLALKTLDMLQQVQLVRFTQQFVRSFLNDSWLQSRLMVHHAQRFLNPEGKQDQSVKLSTESLADTHWQTMKRQIDRFDADLRRYLCFILLDFITCDADLEEGPLAAAFLMCEQLGLTAEFRELVRKELKPGKRALQSVEANAEKIVRNMADEVPA